MPADEGLILMFLLLATVMAVGFFVGYSVGLGRYNYYRARSLEAELALSEARLMIYEAERTIDHLRNVFPGDEWMPPDYNAYDDS